MRKQLGLVALVMLFLVGSVFAIPTLANADAKGVGTTESLYMPQQIHWQSLYDKPVKAVNPISCPDVRRAFAATNLKLRGYSIVPRYDRAKGSLVCKIAHTEISRAPAKDHLYKLIYVYTTIEQDFKDVQ